MLERALRFLRSLKLTVGCLAVGMVLVFVGTLAQVEQGLYAAQERYFQSVFVWWGPPGASWQVPVFPGGYLVGAVMLVSLSATLVRHLRAAWKNLGLLLVHLGLILLLVGQLLTDWLSVESALRFAEGESRNYTEAFRTTELALIDTTAPDTDLVVATSEALLARSRSIPLTGTPFTLRVKHYWPNVDLLRQPEPGSIESGATQGPGAGLHLRPKSAATRSEERSVPAALIELLAGQDSVGTWLVSFNLRQGFAYGQRTYELHYRPTRSYTPFSLTLLKTTHEVYPGSDIPKNFQSRVRLDHPARNETREVDIYMNNPLRFAGLTFYQYQMGRDEADAHRGTSVLQVVRNPGWLTPYAGCVLVGLGLLVRFLAHLVDFVRQRRPA